MKLNSSPFTKKFLREADNRYKEIGRFWASLTLLTSCFLVTRDKWLIMKFGSSGAGKTISDRVALDCFGERLKPKIISGRLTPAGMAKILKKAESNLKMAEELRDFTVAKLIFVEDLSRCTTHYLKLTALQFLAGLTKSTDLDDLTSEGGTFGGKLGEEPKKCMISGTPSDWEEISSTSLYTEYIDRRSLANIALMMPEEWRTREVLAKRSKQKKEDWQIILEWKGIIKGIDMNTYLGPMRDRTIGPDRDLLYTKLSTFKRFPENVYGMIDTLAEGHARLNGRDEIIPEDYEVVNKLFSRFLIIADMKKKELFLVEELIRSPTGKLTLDELSYRMRKRARTEDIPDLDFVRRTIFNYVSCSKYLTKTRACPGKPAVVSLSKELEDMFLDWNKDVEEVIS